MPKPAGVKTSPSRFDNSRHLVSSPLRRIRPASVCNRCSDLISALSSALVLAAVA